MRLRHVVTPMGRQVGDRKTSPLLPPVWPGVRSALRHNGLPPLMTCLFGGVSLFLIAASGAAAQSDSDPNLKPAYERTVVARRVSRGEAELANACVRAGRDKAECVCVTRTLRESLDPADHASSIMLQTARYAESASALTAARSTLRRSGLSEAEIVATDRQLRDLLGDAHTGICSPLRRGAVTAAQNDPDSERAITSRI